MIREIEACTPEALAPFDEVIDVRSPAEYAQDHLPGAINLPVLSNDQRAEVGTIYVQSSKFAARRIGASYVSANIAGHLSDHLAEKPGGYSPLIYCWRGGQRSAAMATVLSQVGWRVGLLKGGYRTYRREVVRALYDSDEPLPLILLAGPTGAGKTDVLHRLAEHGVQTLDLEGLAVHRGSLFGDVDGVDQPSQKLFESRLAASIAGLDLGRPTVVEAESSRIGDIRLPPRVWRAMSVAPAIGLHASAAVRARRAAQTYGPMLRDPEALIALIDRLPRHHSREERAHWRTLAANGEAEALARALIDAHYDPSYRRAWEAQDRRMIGAVGVEDASPEALVTAADAVAAHVAAAF